MNVDDPRLTAYALGELSGDEKAEIEKLIADSPEAQHFVNETQDLAGTLKAEYAAAAGAGTSKPANLIDIRDDPWFWSRARPLAIAALIAVFALVAALILGPRHLRNSETKIANERHDYLDLEGYDSPSPGTVEQNSIQNPLGTDAIARVERVVIGHLPPDFNPTRTEVEVIEVISDRNRVARLKNRLTAKALSKTGRPDLVVAGYQLMLLDGAGQLVAAATFCNVPGAGLALQLSKHGYAAGDHYFIGSDTPVLPGNWQSTINYSEYVLPFPDWNQFVGYAPGA